MKVHRTALKHGVSSDDSAQAADWSQWIEPLEDDDWPHRELRLGFDTQARLLETAARRSQTPSAPRPSER